ncbi:MAG: DUF2194 domain-containing protein [Promethearchaeota archaeon]|nr:MAG: DUF2194 domain-containing protein [Candidatus Lokiarchaeota archaeon]
MKVQENPTIGLDYSHNNKLTLEASSYNEFTNFLFSSGYKLGRIEAGFDSLKKLEIYDVIILSTPNNVNIEESEIQSIEKYVKNGGNLLIISAVGGDFTNRTNLNQLTQKFGFKFEFDEINDSVNYVYLQKRPLITNLTPHLVNDQVKQLVFSSACSLKVLDFIEDDQNIKIEIIAHGGLNTWHRKYDGSDWIEEDCPKVPLIVVVEYYKGRVIGFGNLSMFSSLGHEYGFSAFDNNILIANVLSYLTSGAISSGKTITVNLNMDLFYWANKILDDHNWESVSDIINLAVKYFKDNYKKAIEEIKTAQEEKLKKRKEYEKSSKMLEEESEEDKLLEMIPVRKKEDLEDIMSALEELTGEKYEISIDLEREQEGDKNIVEVDGDVFEYTLEDVNQFNIETSKNAIWHGKPTKAFLDWLNERE